MDPMHVFALFIIGVFAAVLFTMAGWLFAKGHGDPVGVLVFLAGAVVLGALVQMCMSWNAAGSSGPQPNPTSFKVEVEESAWHCSSCALWKEPVKDAYGTPLCCPACDECGAKMKLVEQPRRGDGDES